MTNRDNNTHFFQNYENQRRIPNSIWDLKDSNGNLMLSQLSLEDEYVSHFNYVYHQNAFDIEYQLNILKHYPRFSNSEEGETFVKQYL